MSDNETDKPREEIHVTRADDSVKYVLLRNAAACLDYIRTVRWGEANSSYETVEADRGMSIDIRITCRRQVKPDKDK